MESRHWTRFALTGCAAALGLAVLAGCSSSFGGGGAPNNPPNTVVVPPGTRVVCQDGSAPPCN